jgi:hypothetical protein
MSTAPGGTTDGCAIGTSRISHGALAVPARLPTNVKWLSVARGDADGVVGEKDALGDGMVGLVVEITADDGKDMVVLCARLVGWLVGWRKQCYS